MNPVSMHSLFRIAFTTRALALAVTWVTLTCSAGTAFAQNPFGDDGAADIPQPRLSTDQLDEELMDLRPSADKLIIASIANSNPQTVDELVVAIDTLFDIDADTEAKQYLVKLAGIDANDAQMFSLHRKTGTPFFVDLASRLGMQPEGRQYAEKVLDAAWRYAYDPRRLDSLTRQLANENIYNRSDALDQLQAAGESGAAAIINALNQPERRDEFPRLRTALSKFGPGASRPLIGAVLSENLAIRTEATQALGYVDTYEARLALYHPFVAGQTESLRSIAAQSLRNHLGYVPSQSEIETALFKAARDYGLPTVVDPYEPESFMTVWRWKDGLHPQRVRTDVAEHLMAARFAEALLFARPEEAAYQQQYLVCALQGMKSAGGVDQPLDAAFTDSIRRRFSADQISQALRNSIKREMSAGAVAAAELLEQYKDDSVLQSNEGHPSPLAQALQYGDQRVTFAAANTISSLSLRKPFAGSSQYLTSLVYLATSQGQRKALVAHKNANIARTTADAVSTAGYIPITVVDARDVFRIATSDPDIELILISDTINQPDYLELIQMLRRDWRSRRIPIGIAHQMLDRDRIENYVRQDPLTLAIPETHSPAIIAQQLSHIRLRGGIDELRPETRLAHGRVANNQLAELVSRESPAVKFDFAAHQETIAQNLYTISTSVASSRVLGRVGTPFAQQQLVSVASQAGLPINVRQAATNALSVAFKENGILLTKSQIMNQYEIYNASGNESDESREILAMILDLLEKKK